MPNLGNAWHIPASPEPRGWAGMRDPVGPIVPGATITIFSGNQFQGAGGNPGNQLQIGSSLFFTRSQDAQWSERPLVFDRVFGNNKYFSATIDAAASAALRAGDEFQYYLRVAYDDHDTTFVHQQAGVSVTTGDEGAARAAPFTLRIESAARAGQWGAVFQLPNVAIHAHVLPNGKVLMWGRRDRASQSLDVHECTPFVWDPKNKTTANTPQPTLADGTTVNLFCSGHAFLPDGRLLVVGGHWFDSDGLNQASLYDWKSNSWTATANMGSDMRRWYPTAITLPSGGVLVLSGSHVDPTQTPDRQTVVVDLLQVWENGTWKTIPKADGQPLNFIGLPLYPRVHVASDGRVFMSGTNATTKLLKTSQPGEWQTIADRAMGVRDYCPAVMYDADRVIYIGGGNDLPTHTPTAEVEIIDLRQAKPRWAKTGRMQFARRQHNATMLPDGTVLVTGGTRGGGGPQNGFNDLGPGQPVHVAELWDPATGKWTQLSAESVDRCYHSTAVLLPDATVLSAGGGEYRPDGHNDNDPADSHRDAQIFSPPYLFKGTRPTVSSVPSIVGYGEAFKVSTPTPSDIAMVSWIRLPSVTHSFDENQRINVLTFTTAAGELTVTAPSSPNACPPGHYMLFLVNKAGVPSVASIVRIRAAVAPVMLAALPVLGAQAELLGATSRGSLRVFDREQEVLEKARGTAVVVGITGTCPYGIGACWGGAYEALKRLHDVDLVSPVPNTDDSTATVYLKDERLPDVTQWDREFRRVVNGTYVLRGVEVTLRGVVQVRGGKLVLARRRKQAEVQLAPLEAGNKIQWSRVEGAPKPPDEEEVLAFERLSAAARGAAKGVQAVVTGPLARTDGGYEIRVRRCDISQRTDT